MRGRALRAMREQAGMTQAGVGERMGWAQPHVARLERGGVEPSLDTLERYAAALGRGVVVTFTTADHRPACEVQMIEPVDEGRTVQEE